MPTNSAGTPTNSAGTGQPMRAHRATLALLHSPVGRFVGSTCGLCFIGRASGRSISLPVQCTAEGSHLVIYVGHAETKRWWLNFIDPRSVRVRVAGVDRNGVGRVVTVRDGDRAWAEGAYRRRFPRVAISAENPMVVLDLASPRSVGGRTRGGRT